MNEHDISANLHAIHLERAAFTGRSELHRRVREIQFDDVPQQHRWLQLPTVRIQSLFSATKFVVAGAIVALVGGLLLVAQPFDQRDASVPGSAGTGAGTFSPAGSLPARGTANHTATLLSDGRVLIVGGGGDVGRAASASVWAPATASFDTTGSLAASRSLHTATLLSDGRVLVVGGGGVEALASAEVWDPATDTFGPTGSLAEGRFMHTATALPDGRVLVVGGSAGFYADAFGSAEVWDPETGSFGPAGKLDEPRWGHTATLLPDGRVLVVGGSFGGDDLDPVGSAEVWDPETGSFGPAGTLHQARTRHTATPLPDGRVLVVGGYRGRTADSMHSAEVWDPRTASFGPAGYLVEARVHHTATPLPDGRVLVIGGAASGEFPIAAAEIWDPETGSLGPAGSLAEVHRLGRGLGTRRRLAIIVRRSI